MLMEKMLNQKQRLKRQEMNVQTLTVFKSNNDGAVLIDLNSETVFETKKHGWELKENDDENEEEEKEEQIFLNLLKFFVKSKLKQILG